MPTAEATTDIGAILSDFCNNISDQRPLGVAVSGGSDSLSLLLGMTRSVPLTQLVALTVDHGLRDCSADEARAVKRFCRRLGVRHETLLWKGEKPVSGLQAKAREARYHLLTEAAARLGLAAILTGHTADDQAETLAMRHDRGLRDGAPGLTGIPRASLFDSRAWVLRPLLGVDRAGLRGYLVSAGVDWIEDPSNRDTRFERVRVRERLKAEAMSFVSGADVSDTELSDAVAARVRVASQAAAFVDQSCETLMDGTWRVAVDAAAAGEAGMMALQALIRSCGGGARPLDRRGKLALQAFVSGCQAGSALAVGRTLIKRDGAGFVLMRERRGLEELVIAPGQSADWDRRFRITNLDRYSDLRVAADHSEMAMPLFSRDFSAGCRSWSPAGGTCGGFLVERLVGGFSRVLPVYELPLAQALARLTGGKAFSECPWAASLAIGSEMA
ncbi:tRNA lysidine(34) synthetase TilS [Hoeflea sp.]|uniref:tRNA lysidine(34) synthetase TilS n=1 Tax=Hoeflea sp. TaxID=1940281 RepID=UPI003747E8D8